MMNFFTQLLTPVFVVLGMVSAPVEIPVDVQPDVQQELIELRQKVQEFESQKESEVDQEVEDKVVETKPVEVKKEVVKPITNPVVEIKPKPSLNYQQKILEPIEFEFKDIKIKTEKTEATINWSTTLPSDSRLVIHRNNLINNIFPSNANNSKNHNVTIIGLNSSSDYTYELIATNENDEISQFDSFNTERELIFRRLENEDECYVFVAEDTSGRSLAGEDFQLHGTMVRTESRNRMYPRVTLTTDKNGEFEYCENVNKIRIVDSINEEVYSLMEPSNQSSGLPKAFYVPSF
jgi:hypothetical protein